MFRGISPLTKLPPPAVVSGSSTKPARDLLAFRCRPKSLRPALGGCAPVGPAPTPHPQSSRLHNCGARLFRMTSPPTKFPPLAVVVGSPSGLASAVLRVLCRRNRPPGGAPFGRASRRRFAYARLACGPQAAVRRAAHAAGHRFPPGPQPTGLFFRRERGDRLGGPVRVRRRCAGSLARRQARFAGPGRPSWLPSPPPACPRFSPAQPSGHGLGGHGRRFGRRAPI